MATKTELETQVTELKEEILTLKADHLEEKLQMEGDFEAMKAEYSEHLVAMMRKVEELEKIGAWDLETFEYDYDTVLFLKDVRKDLGWTDEEIVKYMFILSTFEHRGSGGRRLAAKLSRIKNVYDTNGGRLN